MSTPPDADRYLEMKLELICPKCDSAGLIPWQHLDRVLLCRRCSIFFRVEAGGLVELEETFDEHIRVQVRSSSSQWHDHKAVIGRASSRASRLVDWAMKLAASNRARWSALCGALLLIVGGVIVGTRTEGPPPAVPLPTALDERAVLLTEALARRDLHTLTGLTEPSQHRALRIWLAHGSGLPGQVQDKSLPISSKVVRTEKANPAGDNVNVRMRIRLPHDGQELLLDERWVLMGEVWYFRPVRVRLPAVPVKWGPNKRPPRGKA